MHIVMCKFCIKLLLCTYVRISTSVHCVTPFFASASVKNFRSDVTHALIAIGVDNVTAIETGGVPYFTAKYNNIHFVVTCVYTSSDVTYKDINLIIEAKQVTGSTKGLLISNQPTTPAESLLTLEDAGCQFVPVGGYGEEGWEDRMIDKFKGVFPKVANDDSKVSSSILTVHCTSGWLSTTSHYRVKTSQPLNKWLTLHQWFYLSISHPPRLVLPLTTKMAPLE